MGQIRGKQIADNSLDAKKISGGNLEVILGSTISVTELDNADGSALVTKEFVSDKISTVTDVFTNADLVLQDALETEVRDRVDAVNTLDSNLKEYADGKASDAEAAAKAYADGLAQGLNIKAAVRVATTENIDLATGGLLIIDGITLSEGDRVLVKNQSNGVENGIYAVATGAWVRSEDMDETHEFDKNTFMFVSEGVSLSDTGWVMTLPDTNVTIGTSVIVFTQFSNAGVVLGDDSTIVKNGNTISVKEDGITTTELADNAVETDNILDGAVTNDKITSVAASKATLSTITGITATNVQDAISELNTDIEYNTADLQSQIDSLETATVTNEVKDIQVVTAIADRDAIPASNRRAGMQVTVKNANMPNENGLYILDSDLTTWKTTFAVNNGVASGPGSFSANGAVASGAGSFSANGGVASGDFSVAFGMSTASGAGSVAFGVYGIAEGVYSLINGESCTTSAQATSSVALGNFTKATNKNSFAMGDGAEANGDTSFSLGHQTEANGNWGHAIGRYTKADGQNSYSQGLYTTASGYVSHAEGYNTIASGVQSHAQGKHTTASGLASHAGGKGGELDGPDWSTVVASGEASFNHSAATLANLVGAAANHSAILGGLDNQIQTTALRSVVLGGQGINATLADTVYMPNAYVTNLTPTSNNHLTSKQYVDDAVSSGVSTNALNNMVTLELIGGTATGMSDAVMYTGTLTLSDASKTDAIVYVNGIKMRLTEMAFFAPSTWTSATPITPENAKPSATNNKLWLNTNLIGYDIEVVDLIQICYYI
jgi:hypothetical protein